jgi:hypothetical protein
MGHQHTSLKGGRDKRKRGEEKREKKRGGEG